MKQTGEALTILLVEDNDDHAELVLRTFEDHVIANQMIRVCDGREALDYLLQCGRYQPPAECVRPNLILLDLRLPKIDGLEVLQTIKQSESLRSIPVVMLTSSESESDVARAYGSYANSYLVKPLDFVKFSHLMKDLGYYWLCWNTNPRGQS